MKNSWGYLAVLLVGVLFLTGLIQLILLRFEAGDVYPPYSSLRADPLGCKALYESLTRLTDLQVTRNFHAWNEAKFPDRVTVIFVGFDRWKFEYGSESHRRALLDRVAHGARMIFAFRDLSVPGIEAGTEGTGERDETNETEAEPEEGNDSESKPDTFDDFRSQSLAETLGITVESLEIQEDEPIAVKSAVGMDSLPDELRWHSSIGFSQSSDRWVPLYSVGGSPVIVERPFGKGEVILIADSYLLSNEGLRRDRAADVLAWLAGDHSTIVFDETHLGVQETQGIGSLIRKYRLHAFLLGLSLVALLVIWKNCVSFLPPHEDEAEQSDVLAVDGKDTTEGFYNLLRRALAPDGLLQTSLEEWENSFLGSKHGRLIYGERADEARRLLAAEKSVPSRRRNLLKVYNRISDVLKTKGL